MHYMTIWTYPPAHSVAVIERFQATGAMPPEGVTMHARWFDVSAGRGFAITETDDPVAIVKWVRDWSDLLDFEIVPVVNDEQLIAALAG